MCKIKHLFWKITPWECWKYVHVPAEGWHLSRTGLHFHAVRHAPATVGLLCGFSNCYCSHAFFLRFLVTYFPISTMISFDLFFPRYPAYRRVSALLLIFLHLVDDLGQPVNENSHHFRDRTAWVSTWQPKVPIEAICHGLISEWWWTFRHLYLDRENWEQMMMPLIECWEIRSYNLTSYYQNSKG